MNCEADRRNHLQRQFKGMLRSDYGERKGGFWLMKEVSMPIEKDKFFSALLESMENMMNGKKERVGIINKLKEMLPWNRKK